METQQAGSSAGHNKATRRSFLRTSAAAAGVLATQHLGLASEDSPHRRPNILYVCSDQQHGRAYGAADPFYDTPHIDALARDGVVFTESYCTTPQCSPSRGSLYTGLYPHRTLVIGNLGSIDHHGRPIPSLPARFETIGSRLRQAGYHTGCIGKWHLGNHEHFARHFDLAELDSDGYGGATSSACAYLTERASAPETPFALFVNYINPHDIYEYGHFKLPETIDPPGIEVPRPASWSETFEGKPDCQKRYMTEDQGAYFVGKPDVFWEKYREIYREKCRLVDAELGRLLAKLDELGLTDSTLVVYTSDHGDMETHHRLVYKGPFMYDQLVRVPLIIRVPKTYGGITGKTDLFATGVDLVPTYCDFAGANAGNADGVSLRPALTGKPMAQRDFVVSQYYNKQRWVNPIRMIRTRQYKYNRYIGHLDELYDLKNDPNEMVNLIDDAGRRHVQRELSALLSDWMTSHDDTAFAGYWATDRQGMRLT